MKIKYSIFIILFALPCFAGDFDNPYLNYYNKISELEQKYNTAKSREQSTANKLLGALSIGATGIGGMQLAAGMAEQNADQNAESDMKAYLATFSCSYGNGRMGYGKTDIELPGANDMRPMVTEYKQLAADLKQRKDALGLAAGIESEIILDSANSGLYDNMAIGKTGGAYTSLSQAMTDKNGANANKWTEQKSAAQSKTKTGAVIGGVGAVGGAVGNVIEDTIYNKNHK